MGFGTTGVLIEENFTNEKINQNLKYYLEIWLYNLNYKNYTEFLFEFDLQLHSESKESDVITFAKDFKESQIEKNRFIFWELITLNGILEYFKNVIDFYDGEKFGLRNFITQFESEFERHNNQKIIEFIKSNLNNTSIYNNRDFGYFSVEIENFNKYQSLYLHVLMYFDFIKIKDFLNSKFNHNYPIENYLKTNEPQQKDKTKQLWFNIGLSIANGKAQSEYNKNKNTSFEKIATNLGFKKTDKTYFSNTLQNTGEQKDIYSNIDKMNLLFDYCKKNEIEMCEIFINKYNEIKLKKD
jgi:hypothetical protein